MKIFLYKITPCNNENIHDWVLSEDNEELTIEWYLSERTGEKEDYHIEEQNVQDFVIHDFENCIGVDQNGHDIYEVICEGEQIYDVFTDLPELVATTEF